MGLVYKYYSENRYFDPNMSFKESLFSCNDNKLAVIHLSNDGSFPMLVRIDSNKKQEVSFFTIPPPDYQIFASSSTPESIPFKYIVGSNNVSVSNDCNFILWSEMHKRYNFSRDANRNLNNFFEMTHQPTNDRIFIIAPSSKLEIFVAIYPNSFESFQAGLSFSVKSLNLTMESESSSNKISFAIIVSRLSQMVNYWLPSYSDEKALSLRVIKYFLEKFGIKLNWKTEDFFSKIVRIYAKLENPILNFAELFSAVNRKFKSSTIIQSPYTLTLGESIKIDDVVWKNEFNISANDIISLNDSISFENDNIIDFGFINKEHVNFKKIHFVFTNPSENLPLRFSIRHGLLCDIDIASNTCLKTNNLFPLEYDKLKSSCFELQPLGSALVIVTLNIICNYDSSTLINETLEVINEENYNFGNYADNIIKYILRCVVLKKSSNVIISGGENTCHEYEALNYPIFKLGPAFCVLKSENNPLKTKNESSNLKKIIQILAPHSTELNIDDKRLSKSFNSESYSIECISQIVFSISIYNKNNHCLNLFPFSSIPFEWDVEKSTSKKCMQCFDIKQLLQQSGSYHMPNKLISQCPNTKGSFDSSIFIDANSSIDLIFYCYFSFQNIAKNAFVSNRHSTFNGLIEFYDSKDTNKKNELLSVFRVF